MVNKMWTARPNSDFSYTFSYVTLVILDWEFTLQFFVGVRLQILPARHLGNLPRPSHPRGCWKCRAEKEPEADHTPPELQRIHLWQWHRPDEAGQTRHILGLHQAHLHASSSAWFSNGKHSVDHRVGRYSRRRRVLTKNQTLFDEYLCWILVLKLFNKCENQNVS